MQSDKLKTQQHLLVCRRATSAGDLLLSRVPASVGQVQCVESVADLISTAPPVSTNPLSIMSKETTQLVGRQPTAGKCVKLSLVGVVAKTPARL